MPSAYPAAKTSYFVKMSSNHVGRSILTEPFTASNAFSENVPSVVIPAEITVVSGVRPATVDVAVTRSFTLCEVPFSYM